MPPDKETVEHAETRPEQRSLRAAVEAIIYVAEEPVTVEQIAAAIGGSRPQEVKEAVQFLLAEYQQDGRGIEIRELAGGYKMFTKAEHHETVRKFVKHLTPPLKLSMAALETLATIAYRQPVTLPEIQEVRGVNAGGVLKTLLDRKLINTAGRKNVIGRPILYKTTREFLVQFGLSNLQELPSLEEFEELARAAVIAADASPDVSEESPGLPFTEEPPPETGEQSSQAQAPQQGTAAEEPDTADRNPASPAAEGADGS